MMKTFSFLPRSWNKCKLDRMHDYEEAILTLENYQIWSFCSCLRVSVFSFWLQFSVHALCLVSFVLCRKSENRIHSHTLDRFYTRKKFEQLRRFNKVVPFIRQTFAWLPVNFTSGSNHLFFFKCKLGFFWFLPRLTSHLLIREKHIALRFHKSHKDYRTPFSVIS